MVARPERPLAVVARSWDLLARECLTRPAATWRVHSAFRHAFNLVAEPGVLVGVVLEPAPNGPATVVLAAPARLDDLRTLVSQGARVRLERTTGPARSGAVTHLMVGANLLVDLAAARLWTAALPARTVRRSVLLARVDAAEMLAAGAAPAGGLSPLLGETAAIAGGEQPAWVVDPGPIAVAAANHLAALARAIRAGSPDAIGRAARALSGLGPGLTPAGDDALAGLALGLRAAARSLANDLGAAISGAVVGRTTDLAATRVQHALAGRPDETVHDVLTELLTGDGRTQERAVCALLGYGHTSGADTLVGLLVGLRIAGDGPH